MEINASALPRYMRCNGSRLLGGVLPPDNSDPKARNEGTAAHWLAVQCWNYPTIDPDNYLNREAPNGVVITYAIIKSVSDFVRYIQTRDDSIGVEVDCSFEIEDSNSRVNARCDYAAFDNKTLEVADFKHGFRIVEPFENWTMIAYAVGLCIRNNWRPETVKLVIFQPRVPHPEGTRREWVLTYPQLIDYYVQLCNTLASPNNDINSGSWCDKCPSMLSCPAYRTAAFNAIDVSMTAHAESLSDEHIAAELAMIQDAKKRIDARRKQLEDLAVYRLKQGAVIDGFFVAPSYTNLDWNDGLTPEFVSAMTGVDVSKLGMITPTQAINKGAPESLVKSLSSTRQTGFKLTRMSAQKYAEKLFGK